MLAYDERSGWDRVVAVLPYSRAAVVGEKYLLAAVGVLGTTLLSLLSEWVVGGFALPMESIAAALMYVCIVLLLTAISLPPMFRFGVEKGRLFYFVFVGTFVALIFGFGERLSALLAGDALLTYSFRLLADAYKAYPKVAAGLVLDLADAGGSTKMIGGQVEDVLGERDGKMTPEKLDFIHHNKTAALITAAVTMGVRLADDYSEEKLEVAREIGKNISGD